jgi:hypothetical protein
MEKSKKVETQLDRFKETAKALECDEDKQRFEEKLGTIAKQKTRKAELSEPIRRPERRGK